MFVFVHFLVRPLYFLFFSPSVSLLSLSLSFSLSLTLPLSFSLHSLYLYLSKFLSTGLSLSLFLSDHQSISLYLYTHPPSNLRGISPKRVKMSITQAPSHPLPPPPPHTHTLPFYKSRTKVFQSTIHLRNKSNIGQRN